MVVPMIIRSPWPNGRGRPLKRAYISVRVRSGILRVQPACLQKETIFPMVSSAVVSYPPVGLMDRDNGQIPIKLVQF